MLKEPFLVTKIDISKIPESSKMILGDLNGDGVLEMVMLQSDSGIDNRYIPHQLTCITAIDIRGNVLWQVGTPIEKPGGTGSDFPAQIYDIDGDGNNEVLCVMDKKFKVLNGKTGTLKAEYELPDEYAHDCIILANLSGKGKPRNVILKDRYKKMWAMNHDFTVMWTHEGNVGHFPYPYDINGDGYDEIMAGYDMLDHNGKVLWSVDMTGHADCIFVADLYEKQTGDIQFVIGGSTTGVYDINGNELCRYDGSVETQHIAIGKFRADISGVQIAGLDRIIRGDKGSKNIEKTRDGLFLLNNKAELIWKEDRQTPGWLTIIETLQNWDDSGLDYILAFRRGGVIQPTIYDGYMNEITVFPVGTGIDIYAAHASIFGDKHEDVILYNKSEINIFSSVKRDINTFPYKNAIIQPKRLFCATTYPGGELAPKALPAPKNEIKLERTEGEVMFVYESLERGNYNVEILLAEKTKASVIINRRLVYETGQEPENCIKFTVNLINKDYVVKIKGEKVNVSAMSLKKTNEAITVYLAGDSTVCNQKNEPFAGWGQMLQAFFKEGAAVSNHAQSGRSTKSFITEQRLSAISETIKQGDYLLIQFAHNDEKPNKWYTEPFTTYKENLKIYIDAAREKGAFPVLVTPVYRRRFDEDGILYDTHGNYPVAVRQLAADENIPLIDLHARSGELFEKFGVEGTKKLLVHIPPGVYNEHPDGIKDDTHFSEYGGYELAKVVAEEIRKNVAGLSHFVK